MGSHMSAIKTSGVPGQISGNGHNDLSLRAVIAALSIVLLGSLWVILLAVGMVIVPKYEEIFRDFGLQLSWGTAAAIRFARWLWGDNPGQWIAGVFLIIPLGMIALGGLSILALRPSTRLLVIVLAVAAFAVSMLLLSATILSLFSDTTAMTQSLQGGTL